jgi:hypothetical protein
MSLFGWTTKAQTTLYAKNACREKLAGRSAHKLIPEQNDGEFSPPLEGVEKAGQKQAKNPARSMPDLLGWCPWPGSNQHAREGNRF